MEGVAALADAIDSRDRTKPISSNILGAAEDKYGTSLAQLHTFAVLRKGTERTGRDELQRRKSPIHKL
jgi:hypothetical protein